MISMRVDKGRTFATAILLHSPEDPPIIALATDARRVTASGSGTPGKVGALSGVLLVQLDLVYIETPCFADLSADEADMRCPSSDGR